MLSITEKLLREASESFASKVAEVQRPMLEFQKVIDQISEPLLRIQEEVNKRQEAFEQMRNTFASLNVPSLISNDVIKFWEETGYINSVNHNESRELAEDFAYDVVGVVEETMDENCPEDHLPVQLRLTSDGKLFVVDDPTKGQELSEQMERLLRDLKKTFTPTKKLIDQNGYTTIRSIQAAIYKLNGWGYKFLGLDVPIAFGRQGMGYRLSEHIYIHKLPKKLEQ